MSILKELKAIMEGTVEETIGYNVEISQDTDERDPRSNPNKYKWAIETKNGYFSGTVTMSDDERGLHRIEWDETPEGIDPEAVEEDILAAVYKYIGSQQ